MVSVDVVFVQWDTQIHPAGGKTLGSDTVTVNLTAEYANGSKVQQSVLEQPVVVSLAQETLRDALGLAVQVYLTSSAFKFVWQKSIPTQIRQLIIYISNSKG